jgi:hypothetical protein
VYGGDELKISDALAERMRKRAEDALVKFIRENQARLVLVGGAEAGANPVAEFLGGLTWKELVHTTYFDYDEISDVIAMHLVKVSSDTAAVA